MAVLVDHVRYNDLPSLGDAEKNMKTLSPDNIIGGAIREVFLKHAMQDRLCLYLQHRHHNIGAGEAIVKVAGTAHQMNAQAVKDINSFGNKIVPTTWMSTKNEVLPMEFAVVSEKDPEPKLSPEFMADFLAALAANGCSGLFGIDTLSSAAWSETKIGDASVVVPSNNSNGFDSDKFIPVAFAFQSDKTEPTVHGRCGKDHKHTSTPRREPEFTVHGRCGKDHKHTSTPRRKPEFTVHGRCGKDHKHTSTPRSKPGFVVHGRCGKDHKHTSTPR